MNSTLKLPSHFKLLLLFDSAQSDGDCALYIFHILLSSVILSVVEEQVKL
jgi:hypothetical protein